MIGRSLLHESLFCFVFKNAHPSQCLLPPLMLYCLLHKLFFLSSQPFSHSQNSIFGPLLFLYVQPWKSHWLTASNLKSLKSISILKSIQYVLLKLVQISLLSSVSNCLLASPVDMSQCHFKFNMSQVGLIKFFCSQFFKQVISLVNAPPSTHHPGSQSPKASLICHIHFLAEILKRRYLSQDHSLHLWIQEWGWLDANLSLKLGTIFCTQQHNLWAPWNDSVISEYQKIWVYILVLPFVVLGKLASLLESQFSHLPNGNNYLTYSERRLR